MKALLLCGGFAQRLQPLSLRTPKALLPIAGKPGLVHLVELVRRAGVLDVVFVLNRSQKKIEEYFGDGKAFGVRAAYAYEDAASEEAKPGAIGAIRNAVAALKLNADVVVVGSDNYVYGLDLKAVLAAHAKKKAAATIVLNHLTDRRLVEQYGVAVVDANGRITGFQEKPRVQDAKSQLASTAIYVLSREFVAKSVPAFVADQERRGAKPDRLGDLWAYFAPKLVLRGHVFSGYWGDTNNAQTYIEANKLAMNSLEKKIESKTSALVAGTEVRIGKNVSVAPTAVLRAPVIIEDDCVIEKDAVVGPYVHVMKGSRVGTGALLNGCIVFERVSIGRHARIENALVDGKSVVGDHARVENHAIVGYGVNVGAEARVLAGSRLWPFADVKDASVIEGTVKFPERFFQGELAKSDFWL